MFWFARSSFRLTSVSNGVKSAKDRGIQFLWERGASAEPAQHVWNVCGCMDNDPVILCALHSEVQEYLLHIYILFDTDCKNIVQWYKLFQTFTAHLQLHTALSVSMLISLSSTMSKYQCTQETLSVLQFLLVYCFFHRWQ